MQNLQEVQTTLKANKIRDIKKVEYFNGIDPDCQSDNDLIKIVADIRTYDEIPRSASLHDAEKHCLERCQAALSRRGLPVDWAKPSHRHLGKETLDLLKK